MYDIDPGELSSRKYHQGKAVDLARLIIAGKVGVIAGSREMWRHGSAIVPDTRIDKDFLVFLALDSETDDLPLESERAQWDPAAFAVLAQKVAEIEAEEQVRVYAACRSIIDRFAGV
jgi:hypothetical protein